MHRLMFGRDGTHLVLRLRAQFGEMNGGMSVMILFQMNLHVTTWLRRCVTVDGQILFNGNQTSTGVGSTNVIQTTVMFVNVDVLGVRSVQFNRTDNVVLAIFDNKVTVLVFGHINHHIAL